MPVPTTSHAARAGPTRCARRRDLSQVRRPAAALRTLTHAGRCGPPGRAHRAKVHGARHDGGVVREFAHLHRRVEGPRKLPPARVRPRSAPGRTQQTRKRGRAGPPAGRERRRWRPGAAHAAGTGVEGRARGARARPQRLEHCQGAPKDKERGWAGVGARGRRPGCACSALSTARQCLGTRSARRRARASASRPRSPSDSSRGFAGAPAAACCSQATCARAARALRRAPDASAADGSAEPRPGPSREGTARIPRRAAQPAPAAELGPRPGALDAYIAAGRPRRREGCSAAQSARGAWRRRRGRL